MKLIPYEELDKYFTEPKTIQFQYKRIPRKLKKKHKEFFDNCGDWLDLNQKLWYLLEFENPNYKRFLIKMICK
jgi:hypothetical protein